ncbi:hypothetical protein IMY05_001G0089800 [Salix suchowensis]|nr:hypothetical protein IMY05_001G0089800 [Salix suchowensis]
MNEVKFSVNGLTNCMLPKLRRKRGNINAQTMIMYFKELFNEASRNERHVTSKEFFHCKIIKGSLVNTHIMK